MKREHRTLAWLLALILLTPALAFAVRQGRLIGKVVDPDGKPIEGVTVTATAEEIREFREVLTTNKKGIFKLDFDRLFIVYHYRFEKAGYVTAEADQEWKRQGTGRHEFIMHPGEAPEVGDLPPASMSNPAISAYNEGVVAYKQNDYETARARFVEASEHDPYLRQVWEALSAIDLEEGHYEDAVEHAEKAMALGSTDEEVLRTRWEAYRHLGDDAKADAARADLEKGVELTEEAKRIHNEGIALLKAGDNEGAFAHFQEAVEIDPNLEPALLGVATTGLELQRPAEAAAAAKALLEAQPQHAEALKIRYNAALQMKDEEEVIASLAGLAAVDPKTASASLYRLAKGAFERDETDKARERLDLLLGLAPDFPQAHYTLGMILMREDKKEEARKHLGRFLELAPDDPDAETAKGILEFLKGS